MAQQQVIIDAVQRVATGDAAGLLGLLAEDATWVVRGSSAWSASYRGRAQVLGLLRAVSGLIDGGWRGRVDRIAASDGLVVAELRGNNQLKTGGRYDNPYCWLIRFDEGGIREIIEYCDTALVDRVLPPPGL